MIMNYINIALRNLIRYKNYSAINIIGLAIGLAGCLLIFGFVINELSFENFHRDKDRIYRIQGAYSTGGSSLTMATVVPALAPALQEENPDVELAVRFRYNEDIKVKVNHELFTDNKVITAGSEYLEMFNFPLSSGNPRTALSDPLSVLITEKYAQTIFKDSNPIGKSLTINDSIECQVTGVLQEIPPNTQLQCDLLVSYSTLTRMGVDIDDWSEIGSDYTYVKLREGVPPKAIEEKLPAIFAEHLEVEKAKRYELHLFPLTNIYLRSGVSWELFPSGDVEYVYLFSAVALLLLGIASINFINLATARTSHRMKEVSVRKVLGAQRSQLICQFIGESVIITALGMLLGLGLFEIGKPQLENFLGRELALNVLSNPVMLCSIGVMIIAVGVLSGSYPSFYLSRFAPVSVLRQSNGGKGSRAILRKILVVFQFTIAITLIFGTIVIYQQVRYCKTKDMGFTRENTLILELSQDFTGEKCVLLKEEIQRTCPVEKVSSMYWTPAKDRMLLSFFRSADKLDEDPKLLQLRNVDEEYISMFDLEILDGRGFSKEFTSDGESTILLNESAVELFELENPIGQKIMRKETSLEVIGVLKDHHDLPLSKGIMPTVTIINPKSHETVAVRISPDRVPESVAAIEATYARILPGEPFKYEFLEDIIVNNYNGNIKFGYLFAVFSTLAIFIASLGIFGLSSFAAEQRTREIGIRKVLGATISSIVRMISREFVILVGIANLIAWPIAYYAIQFWLRGFAYKTDIGVSIFLLSGILALFVAVATVSIQALKAATSDPVKSLRYE